MLEAILELFISEQKAEVILSNPMIEFIFMILFTTFFITFFIHVSLFHRLKKIRNYLKETNRMDIEPLRSFRDQFERRQEQESVKVDTFVQEKFSSWRLYNVPVVSLIKMVQMTVSVFILIGVLGTFIGLAMSLGSIDAEGEQIVENVASVLAGIDVAFYTSIAGMGFSLLMTVLVKAMNTEYLLTDIMLKVESNLEESEEDGIRRLITVSEAINSSIMTLQETNQASLQGIEKAFAGFQEYTTGLQQSAEDLAKFNDGLSDNLKDFQILFEDVKEIAHGLGGTTSALNTNFENLFTYFKRMDGRNERIATTIENIYNRIEEASTAQADSFHHFEDAVVDLKTFTTSIAEDQRSIKNAFEQINRQSSDLVQKMDQHNKNFKQTFGQDISQKLAGMTTHISDLSRNLDRVGDSLVQLPNTFDAINETQADFKQVLSNRLDELSEFNKEFASHIKAHSADSNAFEKHLLEATNTYEQVGIKNNQLINEINATITQMNQSFQQRENQLEASVGILKDTLSKYVANLEGTLGDKLDRVVRGIGDYVELTNEGIKKEFKELRLITEEIQQSSSRYTQQTVNDLNQEIARLNRNLNSINQETVRLNSGARLSNND